MASGTKNDEPLKKQEAYAKSIRDDKRSSLIKEKRGMAPKPTASVTRKKAKGGIKTPTESFFDTKPMLNSLNSLGFASSTNDKEGVPNIIGNIEELEEEYELLDNDF
jgi:hypothetical protein